MSHRLQQKAAQQKFVLIKKIKYILKKSLLFNKDNLILKGGGSE